MILLLLYLEMITSTCRCNDLRSTNRLTCFVMFSWTRRADTSSAICKAEVYGLTSSDRYRSVSLVHVISDRVFLIWTTTTHFGYRTGIRLTNHFSYSFSYNNYKIRSHGYLSRITLQSPSRPLCPRGTCLLHTRRDRRPDGDEIRKREPLYDQIYRLHNPLSTGRMISPLEGCTATSHLFGIGALRLPEEDFTRITCRSERIQVPTSVRRLSFT